MLVEEGLASVHVTCGDRTLQQAEKVAKEKKIGVRIIAYRILKLLSAFSQNVYETWKAETLISSVLPGSIFIVVI